MSTARRAERPHPSRPRILCVEDREGILFAMREYFTTQGYDVEVARSRAEARVRLAAGGFAVAIVDVWLKGTQKDGLELVSDLRAEAPATRILVLTACAGEEVRQEALRRGADAFLDKPRALPEVAAIVDRFLAESFEAAAGEAS